MRVISGRDSKRRDYTRRPSRGGVLKGRAGYADVGSANFAVLSSGIHFENHVFLRDTVADASVKAAGPTPDSPVADRGDRFGRFSLIERIGKGGMAEVFRAVSQGLEGFERMFVIKRIRPDRSDSAKFVQMFCDEARISALLHHPNIVQVYDFGQIDGAYFMAMEYLRGKDLATVMRALRATRHGAAAFAGGLRRARRRARPAPRPHRRPAGWCPGRRHPPRRQPVEHHAAVGRRGEDPRLRDREGRGGGEHGRTGARRQVAKGPGQAGVSVARAGSRR